MATGTCCPYYEFDDDIVFENSCEDGTVFIIIIIIMT